MERSPHSQLDALATLGLAAATMAHELNNILTPAFTYIQMAKGRSEDPIVAKALDRCFEGLQRASQLTRLTLRYAATPTPHPGTPASALSAALHLLGWNDHPPLAIEADVDPMFHVELDDLRLEQLFINLLLNAHRAMQRAGTASPTLRVTARRAASLHTASDGPVGDGSACSVPTRDDACSWVVVEVADNGPGLPADVLDRLFQPFGTGDVSRGTGLGLMICRHLVDDAGGSLTATTGPDGTTFRIALPEAIGATQAPAAAA